MTLNGAHSDAQHPEAFLLYGSNKVLTRYPELYQALRERGLKPLVITEPVERAGRLPEFIGDTSHPLSDIAAVGYHERGDLDGILDTVASWRAEYSIVGGFSIGEYFVGPSIVVNDYLGFPSPGLRAGQVCRNKHLQRLYLEEFSPNSRMIAPDQREDFLASREVQSGIVKPVGRNSSSGVYPFSSVEELREQIQTYQEDEILLIEQHVSGNEVSVESLVQGGEVIFTGVTQKFVGEGFVEIGHEFPADLPEAQTRALVETNKEILHRLAFQDGISHAEYKIDPSGKVYLIEIAARFPGDSIMGLYNLATGESLATAIVDIALGRTVTYPTPARFAKQVFVVPPPGILSEVSTTGDLGTEVSWSDKTWMWPLLIEADADTPATLRVIMCDKSVGDTVTSLESSADRVLSFVVDAPTRHDLLDIAKSVEASVVVKTV
ncbi:ATP-grasp domain-containing protein [Streptomyces polygonati]|uniref:ATP-grasp domain-containing protein n=1 Tax=Streptomyces polygonati TaxID=1617087 RepID=A0ABV8HQI0_9ACTN